MSKHKIFASSLAIGASIVAMTGSALAQDAAPPAPAPEQAAEQGSAAPVSTSDIVVTGSRIVRDGYTAPTPVTVATTEELSRTTPSSIPDALNKLPQFSNSLSPSKSASNFSNAPIHGNVLNLRGLGTPSANPKGPLRTLILFDGMRVSPTEYIGTIDTNVLPQLLMQRVDVVTGGASAQWGSDAVAGVVNFVLDKKFTGIKGVAQAGISDEGDNANQRLHKCVFPAYDQCIKASHVFNLLDARGVISVQERQSYILRIRDLAKQCGEAWLQTAGGGAE